MLTARQIERYSRQIITPGFGGAAQERLLGSRILVRGSLEQLEPVLPYFAGAGVGHLALETDAEPSAISALQRRFTDLNPDVQLTTFDQGHDAHDLIFAFAGNDQAAEELGAHPPDYSRSPLILVRLAADASIGIIPSRPPCLTCADADFMAPLDGRCGNPAVAGMMAAIEAIKLLAGIAPLEPRLVLLDGYAATSRPLRRRPGAISCGCLLPDD